MMGVEVAKGFMTLEEYIEFEKTSGSKHEYRNGKLYETAGGRHPHNLIAGEIFSLIKSMLRAAGKKCQAVNSDQKIYIPLANRGLFADVMVYCGKPEFHDANQYLQTNPLLVVEVLSESTKFYDKGEKFDLYRSLPSRNTSWSHKKNLPSRPGTCKTLKTTSGNIRKRKAWKAPSFCNLSGWN